MGMTGRSIDLRIESVVLRGFKSQDRGPISESLSRELTRLFVERGVPREDTSLSGEYHVEALDCGGFEAAAHAAGSDTGARVANAIYEGLGR